MAFNKNCFICATKHPPLDNNYSSNKHLGYVFHYLKIRERRKLLEGKCHSENLQLCFSCTKLVEEFCVLYKQLEKVQMEVEACLKLIFNKILRAEGKIQGSEGFEEIREELTLNCAGKLRNSFPQLKLIRLRDDEIKKAIESTHHPEAENCENDLLEAIAKHNSSIKIKREQIGAYENQPSPVVTEEDDAFEDSGLDAYDTYLPSEPIVCGEVKPFPTPPKKKRKASKRTSRKLTPEMIPFVYGPNSLKCKGCEATFARIGHFIRHIRTVHLNIKEYGCPHCTKQFGRKDTMLKHIKTEHTSIQNEDEKNGIFKCDICPKVCYRRHDLSRHKKWHFRKRSADAKFKAKLKKRQSIKSVKVEEDVTCQVSNDDNPQFGIGKTPEMMPFIYGPNSVKCKGCGSTFAQRYNLHRHIQTVHLKKADIGCPRCSRQFTSKVKMLKHLKMEHEQTAKVQTANLKCSSCPRVFTSWHKKLNHFRKVHSKREPFLTLMKTDDDGVQNGENGASLEDVETLKLRYKCDKCESSFVWPSSLKTHKLRSHSKSGATSISYPCDTCGINFSTKTSLGTHILRVHGDGSRETFNCDLCQKSFFKKDTLKEHKLRKHMGMKLKCDECQKEFTLQSSLICHQKYICGREKRRPPRDSMQRKRQSMPTPPAFPRTDLDLELNLD